MWIHLEPNLAWISLSESLDTAQPRRWGRGEQVEMVGSVLCEMSVERERERKREREREKTNKAMCVETAS